MRPINTFVWPWSNRPFQPTAMPQGCRATGKSRLWHAADERGRSVSGESLE